MRRRVAPPLRWSPDYGLTCVKFLNLSKLALCNGGKSCIGAASCPTLNSGAPEPNFTSTDSRTVLLER